jgi:hypothetical protein
MAADSYWILLIAFFFCGGVTLLPFFFLVLSVELAANYPPHI